MNEYDPSRELAESVTQHSLGNLGAAADARQHALERMDPDDPRRPGAMAAFAFTKRFDNAHTTDTLVDIAEQAYDDAQNIADDWERSNADRRTAGRESHAIALHAGALTMRLGVEYANNGDLEYAEGRFTAAAKHLKTAADGARAMGIADGQSLQFLHQWEIDASRRHAAATALDPEQRTIKGFGRALTAIAMSPFSESRIFTVGGNPDATPKSRVIAKAKAFAGGIAAATTCVLQMLPGEKTSEAARKVAYSRLVS